MLPLSLAEIAMAVGGELVGDGEILIRGVAGLEAAGPGDLSFLAAGKSLAVAATTDAAALVVGHDAMVDKPCIRVDDPYRTFAKVLAGLVIDPDRAFPCGVHETAVVASGADVSAVRALGPYSVVGDGTVLGAGTRVGAHVTIGCDVVIGGDCTIHPQVVIREGCRLGDRVIVHAGTVVGSDGFGYLPGPKGLIKVAQVGIVEIADDVELGACVTIDRATTGRTIIGAGSKLDNQVHVAHNVSVGKNCAVSAQSGIAGSSVVGDHFVCGGQVGVADHLTIGVGTRLGGQAGVTRNLPAGSEMFGTPAQDVRAFFRDAALVRRLPTMRQDLRALSKNLEELVARMALIEQQSAAAGSSEENES